MAGPTREWITIPVPGKEKKQWQIDVTFLASNWRCIFGQGCQGVLTEPAPEMIQGCCSYGAYESEVKIKNRVEKLAAKLGEDEWQFKKVGMKKGVWKSAGKGEWRTRLHQDACVFLNRPDFEAGPGCALHLHAMNKGVHFSETKPTVCWQLPTTQVMPRQAGSLWISPLQPASISNSVTEQDTSRDAGEREAKVRAH